MTELYDDAAPAEGTASHLSQLMGLRALFGPRDAGQQRFATGAEDNMAILQRIELSSSEEGSVFSALVDYPSWLTEDFLDIAGVVHVEAIMGGQVHTEISYAGIMHAEDVDETGDTVRLEIAPMYSPATLLARWPEAKAKNIKGVISQHMIGGAARACVGLWVYLGKLENPPSTRGR
jgi:hypothetical protein